MADKKETLIKWLNDAYALEKAITKALENHIKDATDIPDLESALSMHLEQTKSQAERVKECIESLGGDVSETKSGFSQIMGVMMEMPKSVAPDEIIKNALSDYATEHMEIASYTSIIAAAEELNQVQIADTCRAIMDEEVQMATLLQKMIPQLTKGYLSTK